MLQNDAIFFILAAFERFGWKFPLKLSTLCKQASTGRVNWKQKFRSRRVFRFGDRKGKFISKNQLLNVAGGNYTLDIRHRYSTHNSFGHLLMSLISQFSK